MTDRVLHGASASRDAIRHHLRRAAEEAIRFGAPGYGPQGGHKLVDDDGPILLHSPASTLREVHIGDAIARPYKALAAEVQGTVGDGGTTALLLAARLVAGALDSPASLPAVLDGYRLAHRQAKAVLASLATADPDGDCLGANGSVVLAGLADLAHNGRIELDAVDIRCDAVSAPEWSDGLALLPTQDGEQRRITDAGILLVHDGIAVGRDLHLRTSEPAALATLRHHEADRVRETAQNLNDLGVRLVVCAKGLGDLESELARRGILTVADAPRDLRLRVQHATGAQEVPRPADATAASLGRGDLQRRSPRIGGWVLRGPGPAATFTLPRGLPVHEAAAIDAAERLLRLAGAFLGDRRSIPGDGAWQRRVAGALRRAAPAAPGKSAFGVEHAADAFAALADDLVRNRGDDPLDVPRPGDVLDAWVAMAHAVDAAFEVAASMLRLDGRFTKRPSSPEGLRGGTGPAGSPRGMPGDVPPLM